jgi:hypothetical protein
MHVNKKKKKWNIYLYLNQETSIAFFQKSVLIDGRVGTMDESEGELRLEHR